MSNLITVETLEKQARAFADALYFHCYQYTPLDEGEPSENIRRTDNEWAFFMVQARELIQATRNACAQSAGDLKDALLRESAQDGCSQMFAVGIFYAGEEIARFLRDCPAQQIQTKESESHDAA